MRFLQTIKEAFFPTKRPGAVNTSFVFPYDEDKEIKRQQVWATLQKGILFEDSGILIPWLAPVGELDKYAVARKDRADRTEWFLGKHEILDGYICDIGVMKWVFKNADQFTEIEAWLGSDNEGHEKFHFLEAKLTELLGEPSVSDLKKFGDFDLGSIEWKNKHVKIRLSGIEQFVCKYRLYVGLTGQSDW